MRCTYVCEKTYNKKYNDKRIKIIYLFFLRLIEFTLILIVILCNIKNVIKKKVVYIIRFYYFLYLDDESFPLSSKLIKKNGTMSKNIC
jgi:hypothetical protein